MSGEPDFFYFPSVSHRAALEFALQNEVKAADLYESQAGAGDDPSRAEIFNQLAETERKHAAHIRSQLRWFFRVLEAIVPQARATQPNPGVSFW